VRPPPRRSQLHLTRQARAASLRRRQTPAQYPIGWIHQHLRRLPVFGAGSSAEAKEPSLLVCSPECPADVGSSWNPAATLPPRLDSHRPCQTRDSRYHRNAEHADWFRIATRFAPDDTPEKPRRASQAPATSHEIPPKDVQHRREIPAHRACCHAFCGTACDRSATEPGWTGPRILRAETRSLRSPASLGGLDVNADTNRRVRNLRLYTTVFPHDVGAGDVAITARRSIA
jgi:hypothetical protein